MFGEVGGRTSGKPTEERITNGLVFQVPPKPSPVKPNSWLGPMESKIGPKPAARGSQSPRDTMQRALGVKRIIIMRTQGRNAAVARKQAGAVLGPKDPHVALVVAISQAPRAESMGMGSSTLLLVRAKRV